MEKNPQNGKRAYARRIKNISALLWKFIRKKTRERGGLFPLLWKLQETTEEETLISVLSFFDEHTYKNPKSLLVALIDILRILPTKEHRRLLSLMRQAHPHVSLQGVIEVAPMLLYRFTDEQLFEFLQYCFSYEDPDLRLRALKLEHRSAQQFAEEQTGENIFQQMKQSLSLYAQAHCNQNVQIEAGGESFTDGIRIYLPAVLHNDHPEREYRLLTALNVGYIEFGTLDVDLRTTSGNWVYPQKDELEIERMFRSFQNSNLAKEIFLLFEDQRIRLCVGREYPGIAPLLSIHKKNIKTSISSSKKRSVVEEYIALLSEWLEYGTIPYKHKENIVSFDTTILTTGTVDASILLLQQAYSYAYALLQKSSAYQPQKREKGTLNTKKMHTEDRKKRISFERKKAKSNPEEPIPFDFREASEFMERMPGPAGPQKEKEEPIHPVLTKNTEPLEGEWCYPEWDVGLNDEKPNYTKVMELIPRSFGSDFVRVTQHTYRAEINRIKRVFSALKPQNTQMERNLDSGSMLNIDRIIQAQIEGVFGSVDSKPYLAHKKTKRSISVSFLIDLSSSTNEIVGVSGKRIIDIQKEAIVLISEALHSVGDLFSIYGFSGYGRDQVAIYRVKEEGEEWNEITQQRLGNLSWRMENRDGAAIRHVTDIVRKGEGKIKLLFLISDGRPLDCGCSLYHDSYAQADTRAALLNARNHGVQPFCITVDPGGADYLSDMYGQSFVVIKEVEALPMQLPLLYRRFIQ